MTRVYYTGSLGALVVVDLTKDYHEIEKSIRRWKTDLDSKVFYESNMSLPLVCYLIGTKVDLSFSESELKEHTQFFRRMVVRYNFLNYDFVSSKKPSAGASLDDLMIELVAAILPFRVQLESGNYSTGKTTLTVD